MIVARKTKTMIDVDVDDWAEVCKKAKLEGRKFGEMAGDLIHRALKKKDR